MRKYRLRIGLDVDDILYECNSYALDILRRKYGDSPVFDINNIKSWGPQGTVADERLELFSDPEFVLSQPLVNGAQRFVRDLCRIADVFFITSVPPQCMSARAKRLSEDFPDVPSGNIIMGTRKDLVNIDILLDDASHNISSSQA
jgi:guanylate kinase